MIRYVLRRIGIGLVQVAAITLAVFFVIRWLPADPVARLVGFNASDEVYRQAQASLGLDRPVLTQLADFVSGVVRGDLGDSWVSGSPVLSEVLRAFPVTFQLITLAFAVGLLVALPLGLATARRPGGRLDRGVFGYGLFAGAQPEFWWGLMFVFVFYVTLGWAPAPLGQLGPTTDPPAAITGAVLLDSLLTARWDAFVDALWHLVLPVLTLALIVSAPLIKMTRQSAARVLGSEFVLYARASGLPPREVSRSILRAALPPVVTLAGILFGFMLGGAVLVESVFSLDGLGQYAVRAVLNLDYPAIQATVLVITVASLAVYLALDLILAALDPRVTIR